MLLKSIYTIFAISILFSGCATTKKTEIHEISTKNEVQISETLAVDKNIPSGLKRKVAIFIDAGS